jgi:hypothetical protein
MFIPPGKVNTSTYDFLPIVIEAIDMQQIIIKDLVILILYQPSV